MATQPLTEVIPTHCAHCNRPLPYRRRHHGHWQRYCNLTCANRAQAWAKIEQVKAIYGLENDAALREWLISQLNHQSILAVAGLCGVQKKALYHWMERLGIRRIVRFE